MFWGGKLIAVIVFGVIWIVLMVLIRIRQRRRKREMTITREKIAVKEERVRRIEAALKPLFNEYGQGFVKTTSNEMEIFIDRCRDRGVSLDAMEQLVELYGVTNGVPCIDGFDFHRCEDEILFELWDNGADTEEGNLWLGMRDDNMLRWSAGRFCLGDAGNVSYSPENEYPTLAGLIERVAHLYDSEENG